MLGRRVTHYLVQIIMGLRTQMSDVNSHSKKPGLLHLPKNLSKSCGIISIHVQLAKMSETAVNEVYSHSPNQ